MREQRSASQILFGFLPQQTVDLRGAVWKVKEWKSPCRASIDQTTLRQALIRSAGPWNASGMDGGFVDRLWQGHTVEVLTVDLANGVAVEPFPRIWLCKRCRRLGDAPARTCVCGNKTWSQLHFVGYCESCGAVREPYVRPCKEHKQARVTFPGTSSAREIVFDCPQCQRVLRRGFGLPKCQCGNGTLTFNVHRSASVYTPRTVVVVNAPSPDRVRDLSAAGGPERALAWVIDGMDTHSYRDGGLQRESLVSSLVSQGIVEPVARAMADQAARAGQLEEGGGGHGLAGPEAEAAAAEAVTIAIATDQSRLRVDDLAAPSTSALHDRYRSTYPAAIADAKLEAVELVDAFPVLTGNYGYTRGKAEPGESRLVPFKDRGGRYAVYAELGITEALFVRLHASTVAAWLQERGVTLDTWSSEKTARVSVVRASEIPDPGTEGGNDSGRAVLTLVHSFSHRLVRLLAVHAGIDRDALSELLVPSHLGFFVYAATKGDFVLGGLQAVFESGLDTLLREFSDADVRCALDPGCERMGGACMACLHLGEPSCRYFNQYLDRRTLDGPGGLLRAT